MGFLKSEIVNFETTQSLILKNNGNIRNLRCTKLFPVYYYLISNLFIIFLIMKKFITFLILISSINVFDDLKGNLDKDIDDLMVKVIEWRHDIHENPELGNREFRTSKKIEDHLRSLGIKVETKIAYTGVVGILEGDLPGPTMALRADMDALPVEEKTGLPFASKVRTTYLGNDVGVMHACGHDAHVAILMGAAEFLAKNKKNLKGNIMLIFQPAEEGAPEGEGGGAELMLAEGIFVTCKRKMTSGLYLSKIPSSNIILAPPPSSSGGPSSAG